MGAKKSRLNSGQCPSVELKDAATLNAIIGTKNRRNGKNKENTVIHSRHSSYSMKNNNDVHCLCRNAKGVRPQRKLSDLSASNNTRALKFKQPLDETQREFEGKARPKASEIPAKLNRSHGSEKYSNCAKTTAGRTYGVEPGNKLQDISSHSAVCSCSTCSRRMRELSDAEAIARAITEYCSMQRQNAQDRERNRHRRGTCNCHISAGYNWQQQGTVKPDLREEMHQMWDCAQRNRSQVKSSKFSTETNHWETEQMKKEIQVPQSRHQQIRRQNQTRQRIQLVKEPQVMRNNIRRQYCAELEQNAEEQSEMEEISVEDIEVQKVRSAKMERYSPVASRREHQPLRRQTQENKRRPRSHSVEETENMRNNVRRQPYAEQEQSADEQSEREEISIEDMELEVQEHAKGCRCCDCQQNKTAEEESEVDEISVEDIELEVPKVRSKKMKGDSAVVLQSGHQQLRRQNQDKKTRPRSHLIEERQIDRSNFRRQPYAEQEQSAEDPSEREETSIENIELELQEVRTEKLERDPPVALKKGHQPLRRQTHENKRRPRSHSVDETKNMINNIRIQSYTEQEQSAEEQSEREEISMEDMELEVQEHAKGCRCCDCKKNKIAEEESEVEEISVEEIELDVQDEWTEKMPGDSAVTLQSGHQQLQRKNQYNKTKPRSHSVEETQNMRNNDKGKSHAEQEQNAEEQSEMEEISIADIKLEVQEVRTKPRSHSVEETQNIRNNVRGKTYAEQEQSAEEQSEREEISAKDIELELQDVRTGKKERDLPVAPQSGHQQLRRQNQDNKTRPVEERQIVRSNFSRQPYAEQEQSAEEQSEMGETSVEDIELEVQEHAKGCRCCNCKKNKITEEQSEVEEVSVEDIELDAQEVWTDKMGRDSPVASKREHHPLRRQIQEFKRRPRSHSVEEPQSIRNNNTRLYYSDEEQSTEEQSEREEISIEDIKLEVEEVWTKPVLRDSGADLQRGHRSFGRYNQDNKTNPRRHSVEERQNVRNSNRRQIHTKGCLCCDCKERRKLREIMHESEVLVNKTNLETRSEEESISEERGILSTKNMQNRPQSHPNREQPQSEQFSTTDIKVQVKTKNEAENKRRPRRSVEDDSRNRRSSNQARQKRTPLVSTEGKDISVRKRGLHSQQIEAIEGDEQSVSEAVANEEKLQNRKRSRKKSREGGHNGFSNYRNDRSAEDKSRRSSESKKGERKSDALVAEVKITRRKQRVKDNYQTERHRKKKTGVPLTKRCKFSEDPYTDSKQWRLDVDGRADAKQRRAEQQIALQKRLQEQTKDTQTQHKCCCCNPLPRCFPQSFCELCSDSVTMSCCEEPRPPTPSFPPTLCSYPSPSCCFSPPPHCFEPPTCFGPECPCCCQPIPYWCTPSSSCTTPGSIP
ncbi:trichohyalin-like [Anastrepha obliqua]|uniref:trichohyalin-like n=1 Tax=Anastrepha obliqua TaxID=95512 RepID=UPI00240A4CF4|nr:trichohyalin-like [Anastrepha obliqua]